MCFPGTCDGCGEPDVTRAWHCGRHLCSPCLDLIPIEVTTNDLQQLKELREKGELQ